jgi:hypothetical protein
MTSTKGKYPFLVDIKADDSAIFAELYGKRETYVPQSDHCDCFRF